MANTSVPTASGLPGGIGSSVSRRSPFATRRRILLAICLLIVVAVAAYANYGPMQAYRDARARLQETTNQVTALEAKKAELQSELGKLTEAGYLESLARQELAYARPGEDLYIITGSSTGDATTATKSVATGSEGATPGSTETTSPGAADRPGLLERVLSALRSLF